ncbi:hypothetical protein GCM10010464_58980 [Pseudonocardia yunnanensis]
MLTTERSRAHRREATHGIDQQKCQISHRSNILRFLDGSEQQQIVFASRNRVPVGSVRAMAQSPVSHEDRVCSYQEPTTEPIAGGVGAAPLTTVPSVAFHSFAQLPFA